MITPSSDYKELPLQLIDTENYLVSYRTNEIGKFSIFIKFNEFDLSKKPLIVTVAEKVREFGKLSIHRSNHKHYFKSFQSPSSFQL